MEPANTTPNKYDDLLVITNRLVVIAHLHIAGKGMESLCMNFAKNPYCTEPLLLGSALFHDPDFDCKEPPV